MGRAKIYLSHGNLPPIHNAGLVVSAAQINFRSIMLNPPSPLTPLLVALTLARVQTGSPN